MTGLGVRTSGMDRYIISLRDTKSSISLANGDLLRGSPTLRGGPLVRSLTYVPRMSVPYSGQRFHFLHQKEIVFPLTGLVAMVIF